MLSRSAVDCTVHAPVSCVLQNCLSGNLWVDRHVSTDCLASSRRCSNGSIAQILPALDARSAAIVKSPIGPVPMTAIFSPGRTEARRSECKAIARGSASVACSRDISAGDGKKIGDGQIDPFAEKAWMVWIA